MSTKPLPWSAAWRIAARDLSPRFAGLRLLLVCLLLGVGALAAIGSLTVAVEREMASRGRSLLGGDVQVAVWQRALTDEERGALSAMGTLSEGVRLQAMASSPTGSAVPVELKAVDTRWPLVGRLTLTDGRKVGAPAPDTVWIAPGVAERLALKVGGTVKIGGLPLRIAGIIADEPDRLGEGFTLGPIVIVSAGFPARAGLIAPGSMYRTKVRLALPTGRDAEAAKAAIEARFPSSGFELRTRENASPGAERFVGRMGQFLTLVGLAALVIAGIGIAGGVSSYLDARRNSIATFKVLGATSGDIARIYLLQVAAAAIVGSVAGLVAGVIVTPLASAALGSLLPVEAGIVIAPAALFQAAAMGVLIALIFAAPSLLVARDFPAMALMRARIASPGSVWRAALLPVGGGIALLVGIILATSRQPAISAWFIGGALGALLLLAGLGRAIRWTAARAPRPKGPMLRIALANLHRPGAQTGALVTALGFGLSAFVLLAAVQSSLDANISARVPQRAPDFFVLDIPRDRTAEFQALVRQTSRGAAIRMVPALRGAILAYGPESRMTRVSDLKDIPEEAWPLRGERGLTYSDDVPEGNTITSGHWWPKGYTGEPLVSVDEKLAEAINLKLGDRLTIGVLGVERTARIASFRRIDWDSMGFNYVLVFSPNSLSDAPHNLAATIDLPPQPDKGPLLRGLVAAFPSSSVIEVGPVLAQARDLLGQVSSAVLAAASVAVLAGLAVLLGAIAAARASRVYDSVILRVLGASRRQLLMLVVAEYAVLALVVGLLSLALGGGLAWLVVVELFDFEWLSNWPLVITVLVAGITIVVSFALAASLPVLTARPAASLREL